MINHGSYNPTNFELESFNRHSLYEDIILFINELSTSFNVVVRGGLSYVLNTHDDSYY